jgi:translation initiation factor 2B subunit (eIF-2B alpha/beta/delta family)
MTSSREILNQIAADNLSGAAAIYTRAIEYFRAVLNDNSKASPQELDSILKESGRALIHAQSEMAPLYNLIAAIHSTVETPADDSRISDNVASLLDRLADEHRSSSRNLTERAVRYVSERSTILTTSFSSAFHDLVVHHPARNTLTVIVPESRPVCEGVQLAKALGSNGVNTVLIADFAAGSYIDRSDIFACGADAVTESYLINKIGTALVSKAMREAGKSTIALFTEIKLIRGDAFKYSHRFFQEIEICAESIPGCSIENSYFEKCPLESFTHLVSDKNVYTPDSLRDYVARMNYPDKLV